LAHADFRSIGAYGAIIPKSGTDTTPTNLLLIARERFPLPLDIFSLDDNPRETGVSGPAGFTKVQFLSFRGVVNPSLPLGSDPERFRTSLNRVAAAFAGSNWEDAQLPKSLRQLLTQARVPSSRTAACASGRINE